MSLKESLEMAEKNQGIVVDRKDDEIKISLKESSFGPIIKIWSGKYVPSAEFIDFDPEDEWDELSGAVNQYKEFPELEIIYRDLCREGYTINW